MERDEELLAAFASELKARRNWRKLSQEELAHKAGVNRTYIAKLELAKNQPSLIALFHIANALGCELPELMKATLHRHQNIRAVNAGSSSEMREK